MAPTLHDRIGRVWTPVYINGQGPFRLVLDTGANRSAVIASLASRIGVPIESSVVRVHGVTGSSVVPTIHVDSIEVGDLWLGNRQLAVVEDVFGGAEGVLGADGLSDMRIMIDFRNDRISIRRSGAAVLSSGFTRVPVSIRDGHLLMFNVKVAGVRTRAMLDTGAQATIGNRSLQAALAKKARRAVTSSIIGVTLDVQEDETFAAPPVKIADITIRGMRVTFGDMYIFDAWKMSRRAPRASPRSASSNEHARAQTARAWRLGCETDWTRSATDRMRSAPAHMASAMYRRALLAARRRRHNR